MWWLIWRNNDNNQLNLRAFYMHAVRRSVGDNERMKNVRKGRMLAAVSLEKK